MLRVRRHVLLRSTACTENMHPSMHPSSLHPAPICATASHSVAACSSMYHPLYPKRMRPLSPPLNACLRVCKPAFCSNRLCSVVFNPKPASVPSACAASLITPNAHSCAYQVCKPGHSMYARLPLPHLPACHPPMHYRYASLSSLLFSRSSAMHLSIHSASLSCPFLLQTAQTAVHKHATQHANKM